MKPDDKKFQHFRNPKRDSSSQTGRASWYPYYAGYSLSFVEDAVSYATKAGFGTRVLDPWNGSGTTTQVAHNKGIRSDGFDLNPAMLIVAKARLLDHSVYGSIGSLLDDICLKAASFKDQYPDDPLKVWFKEKSVSPFRSLDRAIFSLLIDSKNYTPLVNLSSFGAVSALACFFYLALFRSLRRYLTPFFGSNPTWVRKAESSRAKLTVSLTDLLNTFRHEVSLMQPDLAQRLKQTKSNGLLTSVDVAHSTCLPLEDSSFDLVVSSPPYCTRIDYAIKTRPELALLGFDEPRIRSLRDRMLGTPTIPKIERTPSDSWGSYCNGVLSQIQDHPSRASKSYYWKTYLQYFDVLSRSMCELGRVLQPSGLCFLVVQDSHYKNIHVDLARIADDMARNAHMHLRERVDFPTNRTMVGLNSAARSYTDKHAQVESVLIWERRPA